MSRILRIGARLLVIALPLLVIASPARSQPPAAPARPAEPPPLVISLVEVPAMRVVLRDVTGSYEQHPEVITQMFMTLGMAGVVPRGNVLGLYHDDPKEVDEDALRWQIAMPVAGEAKLDPPYRSEVLPKVLAAEYRTTMGRLADVDEPVRRWMQEHGCTKSGPVRMEYLDQDPDPDAMRVRVLVPVTRDEAASPAAAGPLARLAFIAGTWQARAGDDRLLEQWSPPVGDSMMGSFQWVRTNGVWMYELMSIQHRGEEVLFQLRHFDRDFTPWEEPGRHLRMRLVETGDGRAVFENLDEANSMRHLIFESTAPDGLLVRLVPRDPDTEQEQHFRFRRAERGTP